MTIKPRERRVPKYNDQNDYRWTERAKNEPGSIFRGILAPVGPHQPSPTRIVALRTSILYESQTDGDNRTYNEQEIEPWHQIELNAKSRLNSESTGATTI